MNEVVHGDSIKELKKLEPNSVDLLCTDPPYGYSFMGKSWDKTLPDIEIFKECHRVLKPGAFAFVMSAPRSDVLSRMIVRLEDAGFRVDFTPIYWTYASGFPKAMNIGKAVDKRMGMERTRTKNPNAIAFTYEGSTRGQYSDEAISDEAISGEAKALDGSYGGFQPKPAVEVVIVAMKPLSEKTFVDQALKNGKGITWLDDCRIGTETITTRNQVGVDKFQTKYGGNLIPKTGNTTHTGRFPANLLVSDDVLNDGRVQKSGKAIKHNSGGENFGGGKKPTADDIGYADSGSYSRYFDLDAWAKTFPFLIVPKASKREKNEGLDALEAKRGGSMQANATDKMQLGGASLKGDHKEKQAAQNFHPTIKPLTLMSYLITLGSRPGDVVLDPFLGSGTTALAAKKLGRKFVGIEREKEYVEIARARIGNHPASLGV